MARTNNPFVYFIARFIVGVCEFLGFRGPTWAREAVGARRSGHQAPAETTEESSPSIARAVVAAAAHAPAPRKARGTGAKKPAGRSTGKKIATRKSARERTSQVSSL
jgi:hypothetical protein